MAQKSLIDFCIVSSDLFSEVLDVQVKRGAELSTDHFTILMFALYDFQNLGCTEKSRRSSVAYRLKWEALADKDGRKQFATSAKF